MDGVFLNHDTVRNGIKVIDLPGRKLRVPYRCPSCMVKHRNKAIHLYFDQNGATVVSRKVMELIKDFSPGGLPADITVNAIVDRPPAARIDLNTGNLPALTITREAINHKIVVHNVGI